MSVVVAALVGALAGGLGGFLTAVFSARAETKRVEMQSNEATMRAIQVAEMETDRAIRATAEENEREIRKLRAEFATKFAEARSLNPDVAQSLAQQVAIGLLTIEGEPSGKMKVFVAPRCRITAGRSGENDIEISDPMFSQRHLAFTADGRSPCSRPTPMTGSSAEKKPYGFLRASTSLFERSPWTSSSGLDQAGDPQAWPNPRPPVAWLRTLFSGHWMPVVVESASSTSPKPGHVDRPNQPQ